MSHVAFEEQAAMAAQLECLLIVGDTSVIRGKFRMNMDFQEKLIEHNEFAKNKHPGLVGVVVTSLQPSEVRGEFTVTEPVVAGTGYLWAPVIITLADWLASVGTANNIPDSSSFTTIELKTNFLGSAKKGQVVSGVATASHIGKTTHVWDVDIFNNESGKKIALFRCTQMVLSLAK